MQNEAIHSVYYLRICEKTKWNLVLVVVLALESKVSNISEMNEYYHKWRNQKLLSLTAGIFVAEKKIFVLL